MKALLAWWEQFSARHWVAHVLRTVERFNVRGGAQFAAAVTYFSVLSLVPILMLAFSALGLTITVLMPEAMGAIEAWILGTLESANLGASITGLVRNALGNWASILGVGLAIAVWTGSGWVGNLKRAVRALMREDMDDPGKQLPMPVDVLVNFGGLLGLLLGVAATFVAAGSATVLGTQFGEWFGVSHSLGWTITLRATSALISLAAGIGLFWWLFAWFAPVPVPRRHLLIGSTVGAVSLLVLQAGAGYLVGAFSRNLSASVFGSVIVLMLFLNLFATLILYVAAWLGTVDVAEPEPAPVVVEVPAEPVESRPGELVVSAAVARRSLGVGLGTGYTVGAATGLGIGAAIAALVGSWIGRRR